MSEPMTQGLKKLAGPGVAGMESDPPLYHVDVNAEGLRRLQADPVGFYRELGIGRSDGVAPNGTLNVIFSGAQPDQAAKEKIKWCTYVSGDTTVVHSH